MDLERSGPLAGSRSGRGVSEDLPAGAEAQPGRGRGAPGLRELERRAEGVLQILMKASFLLKELEKRLKNDGNRSNFELKSLF